jgi:hypothetical protein
VRSFCRDSECAVGGHTFHAWPHSSAAPSLTARPA